MTSRNTAIIIVLLALAGLLTIARPCSVDSVPKIRVLLILIVVWSLTCNIIRVNTGSSAVVDAELNQNATQAGYSTTNIPAGWSPSTESGKTAFTMLFLPGVAVLFIGWLAVLGIARVRGRKQQLARSLHRRPTSSAQAVFVSLPSNSSLTSSASSSVWALASPLSEVSVTVSSSGSPHQSYQTASGGAVNSVRVDVASNRSNVPVTSDGPGVSVIRVQPAQRPNSECTVTLTVNPMVKLDDDKLAMAGRRRGARKLEGRPLEANLHASTQAGSLSDCGSNRSMPGVPVEDWNPKLVATGASGRLGSISVKLV